MAGKESKLPKWRDSNRYEEPAGPARWPLIRRRILDGLPPDGDRVRAKDLFALATRPTVIRHLNELQREGIVLKEADFAMDGRPGVFYRVNRDGILPPHPPEYLAVPIDEIKGLLSDLYSQKETSGGRSFETSLRTYLRLFFSDAIRTLFSCQEAESESEARNRMEIVADHLLRQELLVLASIMWRGRNYSEENLASVLTPIYKGMAPLLRQP